MPASHLHRINRQERILRLLPGPDATADTCLTTSRILASLEDIFSGETQSSKRRALQRDLADLVSAGRIVKFTLSTRTYAYKRADESLQDDKLIWQYTLQQAMDLVSDVTPSGSLEYLWERLRHEFDFPILSANQVRFIPDALRLIPAAIHPHVLAVIVQALACGQALMADYRKPSGERSQPTLHPHAIVQRGPITYLLALKNNESDLRLYALHRFTGAQIEESVPLRQLERFDLDDEVDRGTIDFSSGRAIDLVIKVRGYLTDLLLNCALSSQQQVVDEPDTSDFDLLIKAQVPETGQLFRWLLSGGANLEVLEPLYLRRAIASHLTKTANMYNSQETHDCLASSHGVSATPYDASVA